MKMPRSIALALLITGCTNRRLLFKQTAAVAPKETITHHFFVSELSRRKTVDAQNLRSAENVVKTETQQTFVNGLSYFITLAFILRWKCVYCSQ